MRDARLRYHAQWDTGALEAPIRRPLAFCTAVLCPPCTSYVLRARALHGDLSRYVCCGGFFPCSGRCGEQQCPRLCLGLETFCCFGTSVAATRFIIQVRNFDAQTQLSTFLMVYDGAG